MKASKFAVILLFAHVAFAQQVTTGNIKPITSEGLHKIMVPHDVRSFSKEDLGDFRIYDSKKNEVPYFIIQGNSRMVLKEFEEYPIFAKNNVPKKYSSYVIDTGSEHKLNGISLTIANSDMVKSYSISGSNDLKQWFGIMNEAVLSDLSSGERTDVVKDISFPLSSYRYLKVAFDDSMTLPVNVLRAGIRRHEIRENNLQDITPAEIAITQLKEEKITVIHVGFEYPQIINRISFDVRHPKFYNRNVSIYKDVTRKVRRKNVSYNEFISGFQLSSQSKTSFDVPQLFVNEMEIEIENKDNQPLDIAGIRFSQLPAYVIAELKPGEKYTIKTGNAKLQAPQYDLEGFSDKNLGDYPETTISDVRHDAAYLEKIAKPAFWQQSWFLWLCIGLGAGIILYFTVSLVKDMK